MSTPVRGRARAGSHALPDAEYEALLAKQGGGCAICGATPKTRRLHTDRDHKTGAVRGLLCHRCNRLLAAWVSPEWLYAAHHYLAVGNEHLHGSSWMEHIRRKDEFIAKGELPI